MSIENAALLGINSDKLEAYESDPWYDVLGYGGVGLSNLAYAFYSSFIGTAVNSVPDSLIPYGEDGWLENNKNTYEARNTVRIIKQGKGYRVFLPMFQRNIELPSFFYSSGRWNVQDGRSLSTKLEAALPGIMQSDASVDLRVNPKKIPLRTNSANLGFVDKDDLANALKVLKSVRFVSAPCATAVARNVPEALITAWGHEEITDSDALNYISGFLRSRILTVFLEFEVSADAAEHICQGEPKLSLLGEYFIKALSSHHLFGQSDWCHNVTSINKIVEGNNASNIVPISRTDENGLTVDGKGKVLWIPTIDNSEFVEQEIETGGMQPDGEWSRSDTIDPERNDYIVAPGINGRNTRQRKQNGRNKLIYTDWHNARLSFTDDSGNFSIMDLSMFRKADAGQMVAILDDDLKTVAGRATLSSLTFALERGIALGASVPNAPELYSRFFNVSEANALTTLLNTGRLSEYLEACNQRLSLIMRTGEGSPTRWTPAEIQAFDPIWEDDWLKVDLIHENSVIPFLRHLAAIISRSYDIIMANPDQIFGRYVISTTLKEMANLLVVVKYAGQRNQLHQIDLTKRNKYLNPELTAIDQIEVKDIPFVSGSVELFPHQVKAWNYLKNSPENVVLDVAAGGGKTLLALLDIAYQIGRGMKFPLIACPENLIKNYINDALWAFGGKMNMVVLNSTTFNSPEWGEEKLLELVQNAPPNTIFLTDYNFIIPRTGSKRVQTTVYGTEPITVSMNTEFLKRIQWGGIWMDESHLTKNAQGSTNKELMRLTATIPYKRQLSGTYISDNLTDVVGQFALMDPQTFGDMEMFEDRYFSEGTRRSAPVPGAQRKIRTAMSEKANVITIRRKEWAALLPRRSDNFWAVEMSEAQKKVYLAILQAQKQEMDANYEAPPAVAAGEDAPEVEDNEIKESDLVFYLQRLERFITAPGSDPYVIDNPSVLRGADLISPKVAKLIEVINNHKNQRVPGKILVWTQYVESAASLYRSLPPDIQQKSILYTAGNASEAMGEFASNPNKLIMLGCEKSMNTGHNLQFCSRICRMETVWNWGTLEQGEARINRPSKNDPRRHENGGQGIHYDWIFCNKSMDVTKNARMISKLLSTVKFYEQNNQAYQDLPDMEPISLSKDNIFAMNDWQQEQGGCLQYFQAYAKYSELEQIEFDSFINDPANRIESYTLEEGEILKGSGMLKKIPYIPQMQLYASDKLGLIPFVQYISTTNGKGKDSTKLLADLPDWSPEGLKIHTEYGDCVVKSYNKGRMQANGTYSKPKSMRVLTPDGTTVSVLLTMAWVITKDTADGEDVRKAIGRKVGLGIGPEVVPKQIKKLKTKEADDSTEQPMKVGRKPSDNGDAGFAVFLETYNHKIALVVNTEDVDAANALPVLTKMGFVQVPDYNYTKLANWKVLQAWVDVMSKSKKVSIHPEYLARLVEDIAKWKAGATMERFAQGLATSERKNFMMAQKLRAPEGIIKPYLVSHNHKVFLCANIKVNAASWPNVKSSITPGISWKAVTGEHWLFAATKQIAQTAAKELFKQFTIVNRKELIQQFSEVRIIKVDSK